MRLTAITGITVLCAASGCSTLFQATQTTDTTEQVPDSLGAAIGALFSGGEQEQSAQEVPSIGGQPHGGTCSDFEHDSTGPNGVDISATVKAGVYGPSTAAVIVTETDDCEDNAGDPMAFAAFDIVQDVTATCENGTTVTLLAGSAGVYRNDESQGHTPEIFGTFNIRTDDGTVFEGIACMIVLDGQETVIDAVCEDGDGNALEVSASETCQFDTGQDANDGMPGETNGPSIGGEGSNAGSVNSPGGTP